MSRIIAFAIVCLLASFSLEARAQVVPLWETAGRPHAWTTHASNVIHDKADDLLQGAEDMNQFCPRYPQLNNDQRTQVWVYLISAMVKYESGYDPLSRMREPGREIDFVTGLPLESEGLLQLSYQDAAQYSFCNEFSWKKDAKLNPKDPKKTILDPYKNLTCGIQLLNLLVRKKNKISFDHGHYWSVLMPSHKNSKVREIKALVNKLSICR